MIGTPLNRIQGSMSTAPLSSPAAHPATGSQQVSMSSPPASPAPQDSQAPIHSPVTSLPASAASVDSRPSTPPALSSPLPSHALLSFHAFGVGAMNVWGNNLLTNLGASAHQAFASSQVSLSSPTVSALISQIGQSSGAVTLPQANSQRSMSARATVPAAQFKPVTLTVPMLPSFAVQNFSTPSGAPTMRSSGWSSSSTSTVPPPPPPRWQTSLLSMSTLSQASH